MRKRKDADQLARFEKGMFMLSLDTEMAWGSPSMTLHGNDLRPFYEKSREVMYALLDLLEKHRLKATWAIVGHLFLEACAPENGRKHPEIVRPTNQGKESSHFDCDPCGNVVSDPIWYGSDIVKRIQECSIPQEIGCHTFSHIRVDDPGCSAKCLDSELRACRHLADAIGIQLRSFVFPSNGIGHLQTLAENKFSCFRGKDEAWFIPLPRPLRRVAHGLDNFLLPSTPVVFPRRKEGLWLIPGSYFYSHRLGWASKLPVSFRVRKIKSGLRKAIRQRALYHLWLHPSNLATDLDLLEGLDEVFSFVVDARTRGEIENLTMGEMAKKLDRETICAA